MILVGLTGGIGSGKTTVCQVFEKMGIPIYNADERAKAITENDQQVKEKIKIRFGSTIYTSEGLNREKLASIVFDDPIALSGLNHIVHPAVEKDYHNWLKEHKDAPYTIKEAAIIFETGSYKEFDKIILITAPEQLRISRVVKRNSVNPEEVKKRIANQASDEYKIQLSDFVIVNDEQQLVIPQVLAVHNALMESAKKVI
jgi:dephospho-CoA kinase